MTRKIILASLLLLGWAGSVHAATSTLFTVPYNSTEWGSFAVQARPTVNMYGFRMVTSTDYILSAFQIRVSKTKVWDPGTCGGYCYVSPTDSIRFYLYSMPAGTNTPDATVGQRSYLGAVFGSQLAAVDTYYQKTVYAAFQYPVFAGSVTSSKYWIVAEPDIATSTSFFRVMARDGYYSTLASYYYNGTVWNGFPVAGSYKQSPNGISVYGYRRTGMSVDQLGGVIVTNTSTGAWFAAACDIKQDFGWWQPLVFVANYLFCPTPSDITLAYENAEDQISSRAPFGWWNQVYTAMQSVSSTYVNATSVGMLTFYAGGATHTVTVLDMDSVRSLIPQSSIDDIKALGSMALWAVFGLWIFRLVTKTDGSGHEDETDDE